MKTGSNDHLSSVYSGRERTGVAGHGTGETHPVSGIILLTSSVNGATHTHLQHAVTYIYTHTRTQFDTPTPSQMHASSLY